MVKSSGSQPSSHQDLHGTLAQCIFKVIDPINGAISTGFFISEDGYALTCYHVVKPEDKLKPHKILDIEYQGKRLKAHFVSEKSNPEKDIAVLKVKGQSDVRFQPAPMVLKPPQSLANHKILSLGFQEQDIFPEAVPIWGKIDPHNPVQTVRFDGPQDCLIIKFDTFGYEPGLSGAPIIDADSRLVIAIETGRRLRWLRWRLSRSPVPKEQTKLQEEYERIIFEGRGFGIPLLDVIEKWPEFEKYCRVEIREQLLEAVKGRKNQFLNILKSLWNLEIDEKQSERIWKRALSDFIEPLLRRYPPGSSVHIDRESEKNVEEAAVWAREHIEPEPPDYCNPEIAKSSANCLRCQAMRKFAYLFLRLDQLPSGGWSRSLEDWMEEIWAEDPMIPRDHLIRVEGGIESTTFLCDLYLRFCDLYKLEPDQSLLRKIQEYLEKRQSSEGGFGTGVAKQDGIRLLPAPRHTVYSIYTLLQLKEIIPDVDTRRVNRAFLDYLFRLPGKSYLKDRNLYSLTLVLTRLAWELIEQQDKHKLYIDGNADFKIKTQPLLKNWIEGVSGDGIQVKLDELFDQVLAGLREDPSSNRPIGYKGFPAYGPFPRMNYYTTLSGFRFVSPKVPRSFLVKMGRWLKEILQNLPVDYHDYEALAKQGMIFWSDRGSEPPVEGPYGDVGMTALMLDVLNDKETLRYVLETDLGLSDEEIELAKRGLFGFLLEHFDDYLDPHRPEVFRYTYGGTYCRILALPPCHYPEQKHGLPPLDMEGFIDRVNELLQSEVSERSLFEFLREHLVGWSSPKPAVRLISLVRLLVDRTKPGRYASLEAPPKDEEEEAKRRIEETIAVYKSREFAERFDQQFGQYILKEIADPFVDYLKMLLERKELRILDLGGGPGQYAHYFLEQLPQSHILYLDASEAMKRIAEARLSEHKDRVNFITDNILNLKEKIGQLKEIQGEFDGIWCSAVLVHFPKILVPGVLRNLHQLLSEDGILFVSFQVGNVTLVSRDGRYFEYYDDTAILERMLANAGFEIRQVVTRYETKNLYGEPKLILTWYNFYCRKARPSLKVDRNWVDECNRVAYDVYADSYNAKWGDQPLKELADWFLDEASKLGLPKGGHILDAGCGPGQYARYFHDRGYQVTALDCSPEMLRIAKGRDGGRGITYIQEDMRNTSFPDNSFDAVFSCASLLHVLPEDVPTTLREWRRILKNKGILFISVQIERQSRLEWDNRYMIFYENEDEVCKTIEDTGFKVVKTTCNESMDNTHGFPIKLVWINCIAQRT